MVIKGFEARQIIQTCTLWIVFDSRHRLESQYSQRQIVEIGKPNPARASQLRQWVKTYRGIAGTLGINSSNYGRGRFVLWAVLAIFLT